MPSRSLSISTSTASNAEDAKYAESGNSQGNGPRAETQKQNRSMYGIPVAVNGNAAYTGKAWRRRISLRRTWNTRGTAHFRGTAAAARLCCVIASSFGVAPDDQLGREIG